MERRLVSNRLSRWLAIAAATVALTAPGGASAKLVKFGSASVVLQAMGPAGMNVEATTMDVRVKDDGTSLVIISGLTSLRTGTDLVDDRIQETLETRKCPTAELRLARAGVRLPTPGAPTTGDARGTISVHCQTRDVTFRYTAKQDRDMIEVRGALGIDMRAFGMKPPTFLGMNTQPGVRVTAHFRARDR